MPETGQQTSRRRRWAVLPVALTAWIGLAATGGVANAAAPASPPAAAQSGAGPDHSAGTAGTSGDAGQPQPSSNADQNPGGANNGGDCGAYCSTRDGSESLNGNGDGGGTGKPCAGCVGRADNKNPPGQQPDGTDANNGYECDGNNGIGKSNPAHTSCSTTEVAPTTAVAPDTTTGCQTGCAAGGEGEAPGSLTPDALNTGTPDTGVPTVEAERLVRQPAVPPAVESTTASRTATGSARTPQGALPYTGGSTNALLAMGAAALLSGLLLLAVGRRRATHG